MPEPGQTRKRQEIWEEEYRKHPYLAGKPEAHLIERFRYLCHRPRQNQPP